ILMGKIEIADLDGKMEQVVNHESKDNQATHQLRARGVRGGDGMILGITDWPSRPILERKSCRCPNMQQQQHKQDEPGRPNQLGIGLKEVAVAVERFGPQKNLEVASQM